MFTNVSYRVEAWGCIVQFQPLLSYRVEAVTKSAEEAFLCHSSGSGEWSNNEVSETHPVISRLKLPTLPVKSI